MTTIPLASPSLATSSDLPEGVGRAILVFPGASSAGSPSYLVLLRAGFCLPPVLPRARCALTAPFHPYLEKRGTTPFWGPTVKKGPYPFFEAVCFLCHCPSGCPDRSLAGALPCGVRTFLPP